MARSPSGLPRDPKAGLRTWTFPRFRQRTDPMWDRLEPCTDCLEIGPNLATILADRQAPPLWARHPDEEDEIIGDDVEDDEDEDLDDDLDDEDDDFDDEDDEDDEDDDLDDLDDDLDEEEIDEIDIDEDDEDDEDDDFDDLDDDEDLDDEI